MEKQSFLNYRIMKHTNPFDKSHLSADSPLKVLVHTDSIDIIDNLINLVYISKLDFLLMGFTPTSDKEKEKILASNNGNLIQYYQNHDCGKVMMKIGDEATPILNGTLENYFSRKNSEGITDGQTAKSKLSILDSQAASYINPNCFIVGNESINEVNIYSNPKITYEDFLRRIRLLFSNHHYFYPYFNTKVNEGMYIGYRTHHIFNEYQKNWVLSCYTFKSKGDVVEQLTSLVTRLSSIIRAMDRIGYQYYKTPNNDTLDESLYHFGYMIMLITGVFDDLASYISSFYEIKCDKRKVGLRNINKYRYFLSLLKSKDPSLHAILVSEQIQTIIAMFYPLRNDLQHGKFSSGMSSSNANKGKSPNIVNIPKETHKKIEEIKVFKKISFGLKYEFSDMYLYSFYPFSKACLKCVVKIVNTVLANINWKWRFKEEAETIGVPVEKLIEEKGSTRSGYLIFEENMYFDS